MDHFCLLTLSSLSKLKCSNKSAAKRGLWCPGGEEGKPRLSQGSLVLLALRVFEAAAAQLQTHHVQQGSSHVSPPLPRALVSHSPVVPGAAEADPSLLPHMGSRHLCLVLLNAFRSSVIPDGREEMLHLCRSIVFSVSQP